MIKDEFDNQCYEQLSKKFEYIFEAELIKQICQNSQLKHFKEREVLMDIGMTITHMPLVVDGSIKVLTEDPKGNELLLYYLEFGETCAITLNCCTKQKKSSIIAMAECDSDVLFIPVSFMDEWMINFRSWRAFVLDSFNERLTEMLSAIDNLVFHSLDDRLLKYLKDKVWVNKSAVLHVTHLDIANDLHTSRVVISRLMKKLELNGIIRQGRNRVEIVEFSDAGQASN